VTVSEKKTSLGEPSGLRAPTSLCVCGRRCVGFVRAHTLFYLHKRDDLLNCCIVDCCVNIPSLCIAVTMISKVVLSTLFLCHIHAFVFRDTPIRHASPLFVSNTSTDRPKSSYKNKSGKWSERHELDELVVGQELECYIVQELLEAKTGAKVFCECGVGRFRNGRWKIVNALLRLDRKDSVARKRASRLRKKLSFQVFVDRIRPDNDQLEVSLTLPSERPKKVSVSSLAVGDEVVGTVVRTEAYGALIDVGANRHGLLHIQRVGDLYSQFIAGEKGLHKAGVELRAKLRLQVASIEKKRLFLDFTDDAKQEAAKEKERKEGRGKKESVNESPEEEAPSAESLDEAAAWAAYATQTQQEETEDSDDDDDDDDEDYDGDEYDEDRDIEDALGLGRY
jgi:predicted RNA-binding protein with RPS1 domain